MDALLCGANNQKWDNKGACVHVCEEVEINICYDCRVCRADGVFKAKSWLFP